MPVRFLTEADREALNRFPNHIPGEDMIRFFTLSPSDLVEVQKQRGAHNRLGFAVQLCALRYLGFAPDDLQTTPQAILTCLGKQLNVPPEVILRYGQRIQTRTGHYQQIQRYLGFRKAKVDDIEQLRTWLLERALEHDKPILLFQLACEKLLREKIIRLGITRLERMVASARQDAQKETFRSLSALLTQECRTFLDTLLLPHNTSKSSPLTWLRKEAQSNTAQEILLSLKKLSFLRQSGVEQWDLSGITPNRLKFLARLGRKATTQYLHRLHDERRYPILIAFVHEALIEVTDETIEMYDRCLWALYKDAKKDLEEFQKKSFRSLNDTLRMYQQLAKVIVDTEVDNQSIRSKIYDTIIPHDTLCSAIQETDHLIRPKDGNYLDFFRKRYSYIRQFSPAFLDSFTFQSHLPNDRLLQAIDVLRAFNTSGPRRKIPKTAPQQFIPEQWKPYVESEQEHLEHGYYELCLLLELRKALRAGNISVKQSRRYAPIASYLIPTTEWKKMKPDICCQLNVPQDATKRLQEREQELHTLLSQVESMLSHNTAHIRLENEKIVVSPTEAEASSTRVDQLGTYIGQRLPRIGILDLLIEVDNWTHFSECFTSAGSRERRSHDFLKHLYVSLFAQAGNFGMEQMSQCTDISYDQLTWCNTWYIREETLRPANTNVVNYQHHQPLSQYWGSGTFSSSDGQRFPISGKFRKGVPLPKYFGYGQGVTFYTWSSDQLSQYGTKFVASTMRDATYVLDEILNNETDLQILEHTTDTAGYTELIFALFDLLGLQFSPRIRDIGTQYLYRPETCQMSHYPHLQHRFKGIVHYDRILHRWDDILHAAGSLKCGWVTASMLIQKLQAFPRKNMLTQVLQEYGKLIKTIFILKWYANQAYRRRITRQLNKGEALHGLRSYLHVANKGYIRKKDQRELTNQVQCLNLVTNAVITWNTVYMNAILDELKQEGKQIYEEDLQRLWPTRYEHINMYGKYTFNIDEERSRKGLRPLREPRIIFP